MNAERLEQLRKLCNSTKGLPFRVQWTDNGKEIASAHVFYAAARTAVPEMLDEIERLQKIISKKKCCSNCKHYKYASPAPLCFTCIDDYNNWEPKE